jgi:prepilin-type N-terminal cleavage/methylation domain-containing protein/prepilin-type processing-associated H-X9-DG protein
MKKSPRHGFTLTELLVVITLVGLLAAFLVPAIGGALQSLRLMQCSEHLCRIGQAYRLRGADDRLSAQASLINIYTWRSALLPYLDYCSDVLVCPEENGVVGEPEEIAGAEPGDTEPVGGGGGAGGSGGGGGGSVGQRSTENLRVEVWLRPGVDFRGIHENELIYVMDCEEGYWARKFDAGTTNPNKEVVPPGTYEFWFEDSWNVTWNDLGIRFQDMSDGSLQITYIGENTGGNCYNLIDISTGQTLLQGMGDGNAAHGWARLAFNTSVTAPPEDSAPVTDPSGGGGSGGSGGSSAAAYTSITSNYGMNFAADKKPPEALSGHIILCMDYKRRVAKGPTVALPEVPDFWQAIGWQTSEGIPVFARHARLINILFTDGSVGLRSPSELDPIYGSMVERHWSLSAW